MKKQVLLLAIIFSSSVCFAQKKKEEKKEEYKRDTLFILKGALRDFQILYTAILSPRDVTPNQVDELKKWVQSIKPEFDSVKIVK